MRRRRGRRMEVEGGEKKGGGGKEKAGKARTEIEHEIKKRRSARGVSPFRELLRLPRAASTSAAANRGPAGTGRRSSACRTRAWTTRRKPVAWMISFPRWTRRRTSPSAKSCIAAPSMITRHATRSSAAPGRTRPGHGRSDFRGLGGGSGPQIAAAASR